MRIVPKLGSGFFFSYFDAGRWTLDAGRWTLDAGRWTGFFVPSSSLYLDPVSALASAERKIIASFFIFPDEMLLPCSPMDVISLTQSPSILLSPLAIVPWQRCWLALSVRTYFDGDFVIFRNSEEPLFRLERKGIEEIYLPTPELHGLSGAEYSWCWKYRVRDCLKSECYEKVVFLDCDTLILRNIDHLLEGDWDICYQKGSRITTSQFSCFLTDEERASMKEPGVNSGTIAVRSEIFQDVMAEWDRIDTGPTTTKRYCSDQGSWNRLLLNAREQRRSGEGGWRAVPFAPGEVQFPMYLHPHYNEYKDAALVHCLGGDTRDKLKFMFGLYMSSFFWDDKGVLLTFWICTSYVRSLMAARV